LYLFRSFLYGVDVNIAIGVEGATHQVVEGGGIFVASRMRDDLVKTPWAARLQRIELTQEPSSLKGIVIYRLV
jgi:hypothetical protein